MLQLFLFLHVMGAIAVFGPSFAFPVIARQVRRAPQHGHFAAELSHTIESRIVLPGAIVQGITGVCLILILGADLTSPAYRWLVAAIVLYGIAIAYGFAVQGPAAARMVELTAAATAGPPPAGAPAGPPPELVANGQKLARGGMILTVLIVLIVILMVTKPGV